MAEWDEHVIGDVDDGDDDDVMAAFRQLQHNHSRLMREKQAMEGYYEEAIQDTEQKEEALATLKRRNSSLAAMARHLNKANKQTTEQLARLQDALDNLPTINVKISTAIDTIDEEEQEALDEARQILSELKTSNVKATYTDALAAAHEDVERMKQEITALHGQLGIKDGQLSRLEDQKEEFRYKAAELERRNRGRPTSFVAVEESCADISDVTPAPPPEAPVVEAGPDAEKIAEEIKALEAKIKELEGELAAGKDRLDEALAKYAKTKKALKRARAQGFQLDEEEELALGEELARVKQRTGLNKQEANQLIVERVELKQQLHDAEERLLDGQLQLGKLLWDKEKILIYCRKRDSLILDVLKKGPSRKRYKQLMAVLQTTDINSVFTDDGEMPDDADVKL